MQSYAPATPISQAPPEVRSTFMTAVYVRLLFGIGAFILASWALFTTGVAYTIAEFVLGTSWLLILGGFMVVSWMSTRMLVRARTPAAQYGAYALVIGANVLLFATPLVIAEVNAPGAIELAAQTAMIAFAVLSLIAIRTSKDFSFLRGFLMWGGFLALGLIVLGTLTGFNLGLWFTVGMIGFAGAAILYDTQKIYRTFPVGTETVAAVQLFSSIALLFWYLLQLFSRR